MSIQAHQEYIQTKINPILESLVTQVLLERPEEPIPFMIAWLSDQAKTTPGSERQGGGETAESLRRQVAELKEKIATMEGKQANGGGADNAAQ
mmetsp:Transcript_45885/g.99715  ORF Transcript_45885/g.99715 Transcript_45885/m.99715 type:complete len:93 (+) Transcript_45885:68-346(+)|eukprot:CAMPEP_0204269356 /NCGR_PEP_ID=MMETSP0468-20130131/15923_1 /ASSEMBLY_ACC=CAM_ASM_000383 /TAXON_ID=2969 /ORGANISM="Oxyrrhis marina" /LENGTH=92 /DNA_ID=CAMNT_0051244731 /DNA_START=64 /DNA_END=342 /DNA_ORIENTATION=+